MRGGSIKKYQFLILLIAGVLLISFGNSCSPFRSIKDGSSNLDLLSKYTCEPSDVGFIGHQIPSRLNKTQLENSVTNLLGVSGKFFSTLSSDSVIEGFDNIAIGLSLSPLGFESYTNSVETAIDAAKVSSTINDLFSCPTKTANTEACAQDQIFRFAERAYRRTLSVDETNRLLKVYRESLSYSNDIQSAVKNTFVAVMVSPHFLYKTYLVPAQLNISHGLDDFGLATRLSYFLTGTAPDQNLLNAAKSGQLKTQEGLKTQFERLIKTPQATNQFVDNFAGQWLKYKNILNQTLAPEYNLDTYRQDLFQETNTFLRFIFDNNLPMQELLDAKYSFWNGRLSEFYGAQPSSSTSFVKTDFGSLRRRGIATHASVLAGSSEQNRTHLIRRGLWVMENIMCATPPPPPANVPSLPPDSMNLTQRQRLEAHRSNPSCVSCHSIMDPIGFAFEAFDPIGRLRSTDRGIAVDSTGSFPSGEFFNDAEDVIKIIGKGDTFDKCVTKKLVTFALERSLVGGDKCFSDSLGVLMSNQKFGVKNLMWEIVNSQQFRTNTYEGWGK